LALGGQKRILARDGVSVNNPKRLRSGAVLFVAHLFFSVLVTSRI
jgi:hypothetical protein